MNRADLQQLAAERLLDAEALLSAGRWSGAYYLAGYAVECALKACIAKLTNQFDFPNKEVAQKCYTHNIGVLVAVAGLETQRKIHASANKTFAANWLTVKDWEENSRYQQWLEIDARNLYSAITNPTDGVFPWVMVHW